MISSQSPDNESKEPTETMNEESSTSEEQTTSKENKEEWSATKIANAWRNHR